MEASAFRDRASAPGEAGIEAALGSAYPAWQALRSRLATDFAGIVETWAFSGQGRGWALRLGLGRRPLVFLTPLRDRFRASLALPERAMPAVLLSELPAEIVHLVKEAPTYREGRAVRLEVLTEDDASAVIALVRIRMAS